MPTLLHIDTSPLGDRSVSRHLTAAYTEAWRTANPGATVVTRDLSKAAIPALDADWIQASYTPAGARTTKQQAALRLSDDLIAELKAADHSVFGVPMHNFSIPATLKLWIDQIARVGETFRYEESGPVGLITGKTATFIASSGGTYGPGGASLSLNFVEPYLRAVFGFIGVTDVDFLTAGGAAALMSGGIEREVFLKPHIDAIRERFAA